jgi:general secretion pathway protein B
MSYILEALKKAEQQRGLGRVPGLDSVHEQARGGARRRWLWTLTGVLILNAAVLLVVVWPDQWWDRRVELAVQSASPAADYQSGGPSEQPLSPQAAQAEVPYSTGEPVRQPQLSAPAPDEQRQQQFRPRPAVVGDAQIPARPQHTEPRSSKAVRIPTWPQIPGYLLEQLSGSLRLDVHVFAAQPAERFVLINMRKYHQGQQLQEGPRLDEITADGVILSLQGEKFRLQAQ